MWRRCLYRNSIILQQSHFKMHSFLAL